MLHGKACAIILGEITIETSVISGTTNIGTGTTVLEVEYPANVNIQFQSDQESISITSEKP